MNDSKPWMLMDGRAESMTFEGGEPWMLKANKGDALLWVDAAALPVGLRIEAPAGVVVVAVRGKERLQWGGSGWVLAKEGEK